MCSRGGDVLWVPVVPKIGCVLKEAGHGVVPMGITSRHYPNPRHFKVKGVDKNNAFILHFSPEMMTTLLVTTTLGIISRDLSMFLAPFEIYMLSLIVTPYISLNTVLIQIQDAPGYKIHHYFM